MNLAAFHFLRPYFLLALVPLGCLLFVLARTRSKNNPWRAVCDPQLLPHIMEAADVGVRGGRSWVAMALGGLLAILALAGPTWKRLPQPAYLNQSGLVIVLDLSSSMRAADLKPSRLLRARYKIADILHNRHDGQTGLVVYAGDAFTVTPMTDDTNTIYSQLSVLDTSLMPSRGDRADLGIDKAASLLAQAGLRHGNVLLVTDGVDADRLAPAIKKLRKGGYRLSILGVGTAQGAPVPLPGGGFQLDGRGAVVLSRLRPQTLRRMARLGGGEYRRITPGGQDIQALQAGFVRLLRPGTAKKTRVDVDVWREEGPWLLLPLLALAAFAFRRGALLVLLLILFGAPQQARAMSWRSLWVRPDQQGRSALKGGDPAEAAKLFTDPRWKAAAAYRAGDYARALKALNGCRGEDDWYNRGNALARLGRYRESVQAYQEALNRDPGFKDARFNQKLVEKLLKKQKRKKQQPPRKKQGKTSPKTGGKNGQSKHGGQGKKHGGAASKNAPGGKKGASAARGNPPGKGGGHSPAKETHQGKPASPKSSATGQRENHQPSRTQTSSADGAAKGVKARRDSPGNKKAPSRSGIAPAPIDAATAARREKDQANQQWLRQVPDDPGGLLRRKFYYEYHQRHPDSDQGEQL